MNTPAHMALSLAVLGRAPRPGDWWALGIGALLPDAVLFAEHFARAPMGPLADIFNSAPLYAALLLLAWAAGRRWPALLAASALLHIAFDLPLHNHDAHAHFWPLTDRTFVSPVSFWDAAHHGRVAGTLEGVLFVACFVAIWRRLHTAGQRAAALAFAAIYAAAFVHFVGHAFRGEHWAIW